MVVVTMNKNKQVLKYCPNFYRIINFDFFEEDVFTEKLISIYKEFIFGANIADEEELNLVAQVDKVLVKYIDDYMFRREVKSGLMQLKVKRDVDNILKLIVKNIIKMLEMYEEGATRKIYLARWI